MPKYNDRDPDDQVDLRHLRDAWKEAADGPGHFPNATYRVQIIDTFFRGNSRYFVIIYEILSGGLKGRKIHKQYALKRENTWMLYRDCKTLGVNISDVQDLIQAQVSLLGIEADLELSDGKTNDKGKTYQNIMISHVYNLPASGDAEPPVERPAPASKSVLPGNDVPWD